jgi:hypothetical protein
MMDEIEELWKLADECREWARGPLDHPKPGQPSPNPRAVCNEFERLAKKLDEIANALAARMPT